MAEEESEEKEYRWETGYEKTWEAIKEDDHGLLEPSVADIIHNAKRKRQLERKQGARLGMMRHLYIILDASESMSNQDLKPTRFLCSLKLLEDFIEEFFYQNPISQLGIIITRNKRAEKVSDLAGNSKKHVKELQTLQQTVVGGEPSLQNSLELATKLLKLLPSHASKEILVIIGALTTCDPGDINETIRNMKLDGIRCSVIGLAAELYICKRMANITGGEHSVALDDKHYKEQLNAHIDPPPAATRLDAALVKMGFPHHSLHSSAPDTSITVCMCHAQNSDETVKLMTTGYLCPQCLSKHCELPVECRACGLTLVSAPHLARSYHYLFPVDPFKEISPESDHTFCFGCQKAFAQKDKKARPYSISFGEKEEPDRDMTNRLWKALSRRRVEKNEDTKDERLARVLGLFDLTALGVGATLGLGVYVLAGSVAKETAGPAVSISFLIAAIASTFAGMCYAEFASRVPKAGSAYVYSYVTVGEFIAFVIGWNLILEYVIGTASVARGLSNYIDALIGNVMGNALRSIMPIDISFLSEYPDFFAFAMVMLLVVLLCVGVKESSILNNVFTVINLITITIVIVTGSMKADSSNWSIAPEDIPESVKNGGAGGFMPFGISGVMIGAAKCFYGFVGFDTVATTGEEAKNPQRHIPLAIVLSLIVIFVAYFGVSMVLTMMLPYYAQSADAPFPHAFDEIGWPVVKWIVNVGAIFALCTSLLGAMFPLPRVLYAMASDGIIFKTLSKVHPKTMTPVYGTVLSGLFSGLMTLIFNLQQLIDMMSIGTLLAYTIVAICVLILRYQKENSSNASAILSTSNYQLTPVSIFTELFNLQNRKEPTELSSRIANVGIVLFCIVICIITFLISNMSAQLLVGNVVISVILGVFVIILFLNLAAVGRQPVQRTELSFKVPYVPFIPCLSIFINIYLMFQLDVFTWIRFATWLLIGFCIYGFYGIVHSEQGKRDKTENEKLQQKYIEKFKIIASF